MKKPATIFDHLANIPNKKTPWSTLTEQDRKSFSPYLINRWLSMHPDLIEIVDMFQQYTIGPLSKKHVYQLYHDILPKQKMYAKYIKGKKVNKYNPELVKFLAEHLHCSKTEAEEFISILLLNKSGRNRLVEILKKYGHADKEIKKLLK